MSKGSLKVGLQLSLLLRSEGIPVEVNIAAGRAVGRLQVDTSCREVL